MRSTNLKPWRRRFVVLTVGACVCLLLTLVSVVVKAIPSGLDGTFGTDGKVITHITDGDDVGYAVAMQNDGKIVVAGQSGGSDFAVARYNANGTLDTTFDGDGIVITDIAGQAETARALAIQSDGKIVVVGDALVGGSAFVNTDFVVLRYNTNGSLDTTFDTDGKVTTDIGGLRDDARAVALQGDGKIIVAGTSFGSINGNDFAAVRYDSNGALDSMFGTGGKFTTDVDGGDAVHAVAIQSDGKVVVVGDSFNDPFIRFASIRCNTNGTLDTSFGNGGKVLTSISENFGSAFFDSATAVAIQNDGKIVAAGGSGQTPAVFAVVRYNSNGSLDSNFGVGGIVTTQFGTGANAWAFSLLLQNNGKIVLGGYGSNVSIGSDFALARYNVNGSLDATFGAGGKVVTPIGSSTDTVYGIALQSDGRIVAAGADFVSGAGYELTVARYDGGALYSPSRRFDFDGDGISDLGVIRPSNGYWYVLNSSDGTLTSLEFNLSTDKMVPADYTGDGKTDIANFRDGSWRILPYGSQEIHFGQAGDVPVPGDYDGDGQADVAVFRLGAWYVNQTRDGATGFGFGNSTDKAVPGDYDGDGKFDAAVYRDGIWYMRNSTIGVTGVQFGLSTDRPVPADYDGDGKSDVAVYRDGIWYVLGSTSGFQVAQFGLSTDVPVPADYDGDAKADFAVYRDGVWYMLRSSDGAFAYQYFGLADDIPLESVYTP